MAKSTRKPKAGKSTIDRPPKPPKSECPDFSLCPASNGRWQKKILGKIHYFGRWGRVVNGSLTRIREDGCWQEAWELYKKQAEDLHAGRKPRIEGEGLTVGDLCNRFLTYRKRLMESNEISARTFIDERGTTDRLVATFGKNRLVDDLGADDFERLRADIAKQCGPVRLGNEVTRVKAVFRYGRKSDLIPREFRKPKKSVLRKHRAANGNRILEAAAIRALLDVASVPMRAMILLGVNCGFGNSDCATLAVEAVDLNGSWINFPRPKNGIPRRCPLWPETVNALRATIAKRPEPKDKADGGLVFVTEWGHRWVRASVTTTADGKMKSKKNDSIIQEFDKLLMRPRCPSCGRIQTSAKAEECVCKWKPSADKPWTKMKREGLGFYALRRSFRTEADAAKDRSASRLIMGHAPSDSAEEIDDTYVAHIDDSRLQAVVEHVRAWLWPETSGKPTDQAPKQGRKPRTAKARPSEPATQDDSRPRLRIVG